MHYNDDALKEMTSTYSQLHLRQVHISLRVLVFAQGMMNERARECMHNGVGRRLSLLHRCIQNMFRLFPPDCAEKLSQDDRTDLEINLHAFLINIYGIIDNTALALAYENDLIRVGGEQKVHTNDVNLFNRRFRRLLNPRLSEYLREKNITNWYKLYAKNYRDALAHRIPPYVPPAVLTDEDSRKYMELYRELQTETDQRRIEALQAEQAGLGTPNFLFVHSFSEKANFVYLHPQLIVDFGTVEEILNNVVDNFYCKPAGEK